VARSPRAPQGPETPAPTFERADDAGLSRHDAVWIITQQIHELTSDFVKVSTHMEHLISDVGTLTKDVRDLRTSVSVAKGFGIAVALLIPICAAFVWWLIGGKLNDIRDHLYQTRPTISSQAPASPGSADSKK
jgi:hypothetical protein